MIAVDTNVVVRLLTEDDPEQAVAARSLFAGSQIWISKTVLLETAWVLSNVYEFEDSAIRDILARLLGLGNVQAEDEPAVAAALELAKHGVDLADALHLSSRPPGVGFASFDRAFVRRTTRAGVNGVRG